MLKGIGKMDRTETQAALFSRQAPSYERMYGAESEFEREIVEKRRALIRSSKRCGTALDLGTGTGTYLPEIRARAKKVIALDLTPKMLEIARERAKRGNYKNIKFIRGDAQKIPLPDESVDTVYCINTFYHVPNREVAMSEISRVLRKGGTAYIEYYNTFHPFVLVRSTLLNALLSASSGYVFGNTEAGIKSMARRNGLAVRKVETFSRLEASQAVKGWLPNFAFSFLERNRKTIEKFLPRMRCVAIAGKI